MGIYQDFGYGDLAAYWSEEPAVPKLPKKVIEIKYTAYASYMEVWPWFYLADAPETGSVKLELTKEEVTDYKKAVAEMDKWQKIIKDRAFPNMEDY